MRAIIFRDEPYNRLSFIDLRDETEEMKWKILEYHNQPWVLSHIAGSAFTREQHIMFLENLSKIQRFHYIVYFDEHAIGKYSFDLKEDAVENTGDYLFFEKDTMTGLGPLMHYAFLKHAYDDLGVKYIRFSVCRSNEMGVRNNVKRNKKLGIRLIGEDKDYYYFEHDLNSRLANRREMDEKLKVIFADFTYSVE